MLSRSLRSGFGLSLGDEFSLGITGERFPKGVLVCGWILGMLLSRVALGYVCCFRFGVTGFRLLVVDVSVV